MKTMLSLFLLLLITKGVFFESVSVMEGDSFTLHSGLNNTENISIDWRYGAESDLLARVSAKISETYDDDVAGKFKGRLKLDDQTGDLTIINIRTTDSGVYKVTITSNTQNTEELNVTVVSVELKPISVMDGDSVTLHTDVTEMQTDDMVKWKCNNSPVAETNRKSGIFSISDGADEKFKHKLQLDCLTGSLIINNIGTKHSGLYNVVISSRRNTIHKTFNVTVGGNPTPVPNTESGYSVTLDTDTELQRDDLMLWMLGDTVLAEINQTAQQFPTSEGTERFRDRLKLDHQTGSLTITNTTTTDTGLYELQIRSSRRTILRRIIVSISFHFSAYCVSDDRWKNFAIIMAVLLVAAVAALVICRWKICKLEKQLETKREGRLQKKKEPIDETKLYEKEQETRHS